MSFAFPAGFWLAALALPLVLLYVLKLRRRSVSISSTLLWRRVIEDRRANAPWERLRRHLLLLLQLLLLALLVLAFAGPFHRGSVSLAADTVVVLDGSASMLASAEGGTRFDLARARALPLVDSVDAGRRIALVVAGPQPEVLSPLTGDAASLRRALAAARAAEAPADLRSAVELARTLVRGRSESEVVVFTDGAFRADPGLADLLAEVTVSLVGEAVPNAGITSVSLRRQPGAAGAQEVFTALAAHGGRSRQARLVLEAGSPEGGWTTAAEELLVLEPGRRQGRVHEVEALPGTQLRLRLEVEGEDGLPLDDEARLVVPPPTDVRVLLVSRTPWLASRALGAVEGVRLFVSEGPTGDAEGYDLVVLDGVVPELAPRAPLLVFGAGPEGSTGPLASRGTIERPGVVRWDRRHPVLRHAAIDAVLIERAHALEPPREAGVLVESAQGPLAVTWNGAGGPVLQFGFELLSSDLPLRVAFPVLVQDAVDWLTGRHAAGAVLPAGRSAELRIGDAEGPVTWRSPGAPEHHLEVRAGTVRVPAPERVGPHELLWTSTADGSARSRAVPVALLSARETDLSPRLSLEDIERRAEGRGDERRPERVPGRRFLWPWLVALALVAALVEWTVHHRRPS